LWLESNKFRGEVRGGVMGAKPPQTSEMSGPNRCCPPMERKKLSPSSP